MNTIKESMLEPVFEAVIERHIQILLKTIKDNHMNVADIVRDGAGVPMLDKIDASQVRVYRKMDNDFQYMLEKLIKHPDGDYLIVCCKDEKPIAVINLFRNNGGSNTCKLIYDKSKQQNSWSIKHPFNDIRSFNDSVATKWAPTVRYACDEVWIIDMEGIGYLQGRSLRDERREAKKGMIEMNEETFKKIVDNNLKRYKVLAQEIRMKKGDQLKIIIDDAQKVLDESFDLLREYRSNMNKYAEGEYFRNMTAVLNRISECQTRLLSCLNDALDNESEVAKINARSNGEDNSEWKRMYVNRFDKYNEDVKNYIYNLTGYMHMMRDYMDGKSEEEVFKFDRK